LENTFAVLKFVHHVILLPSHTFPSECVSLWLSVLLEHKHVLWSTSWWWACPYAAGFLVSKAVALPCPPCHTSSPKEAASWSRM